MIYMSSNGLAIAWVLIRGTRIIHDIFSEASGHFDKDLEDNNNYHILRVLQYRGWLDKGENPNGAASQC